MTKRFDEKNQDLLYFDRRYDDAISKRPMGKVNVIDVKSDVIENSIDIVKKEDKVPTPRDVLNDYLESTSVHGLQYFGKTSVDVGFLGKILWTCTILISFVCICRLLCTPRQMVHAIKHTSRFRFELDGDAISGPLQRESDQHVYKNVRRADISGSISCCHHMPDYADSAAEAAGHFGERHTACEREQRNSVALAEVRT